MLSQFAVTDLLRATVPVIDALYLEEVLQLVLERNRDLQELHTSAA